jgi:hypothetical protein
MHEEHGERATDCYHKVTDFIRHYPDEHDRWRRHRDRQAPLADLIVA